ncbi:MAG: extracellular solute-binding protein [Alphaproteobacteria bacterium]|nr:extracellular solute-binding protein [Alphaproteobacteria bacterium]
MDKGKSSDVRIDRRTALKLAAGAGLAGAGALRFAEPARAATELSIWTGFPECVPFYQACADAYSKAHPEVKITIFSADLRSIEQKLSAAVPTGTGPDVYDIGTNITVNFIDAGLLDPNPDDVDKLLKSGAWNKFVVDFCTINGKTYGLPIWEGSKASMFYNKTLFKEAGLDPEKPPQTMEELVAAAQKLVKFDASGKMIRSGISLRLSGQGSGICEKFRYLLEGAGASVIAKTPSGKYHNNFDNDKGRAALQFVVDAVQKYKIDDPKVQHDADAFAAGNTAMLWREAWVIGTIQEKNPKLDYGVAPIPKWNASSPYRMLLQPWNIYVNGKSANKPAAWDLVKFIVNPENSLRLTTMTGWVSERQDVDWKPLLDKIPQFKTFVEPPKDMDYYVEPILTPRDEIESKMADKLTASYINPALNGNPGNVAAAVHEMAAQTDQILKDADLYSAS